MEVLKRFKKFYLIECLLLMLKKIYGLQQAEFIFWVHLLKELLD